MVGPVHMDRPDSLEATDAASRGVKSIASVASSGIAIAA